MDENTISLLPPESSIIFSLLRLGFEFNSVNGDKQIWTNYNSGAQATFTGGLEATECTLMDVDTRLTRDISAVDLANTKAIQTWRTYKNSTMNA